ncbi:MAG: class I SAM-dependent methyltransferase [Chloroflexota bacterium]|nr:MAG: class I SAM-dependent methyltransferase [Chloroflexota bacterium]
MTYAKEFLHAFALACPTDQTCLEMDRGQARCPVCEQSYACSENIWRFLDNHAASFQNFLDVYRAVRRAEGWGAQDAAYYINLPHLARGNPHAAIWRVRAASFSKLLALIEPRARILDVGAGNCWLAYQLTQRGHHVAAVDLNDDAEDGLGAQKFYPLPLYCYQADFDRLPFAAAQFDAVIFNASLHYSQNPAHTVNEALRVLKAHGKIIVMDSPLYRHRASGKAMLRDKAREFKTRFGLEMDATPRGFLTFDDFDKLPCHWQWHVSHVDLRWALRPLRARVLGQREPAQFGVMVGTPSTAHM